MKLKKFSFKKKEEKVKKKKDKNKKKKEKKFFNWKRNDEEEGNTDDDENEVSISKLREGFRSLNSAPPELWKAYVLKFTDGFAYFSFSLVFTLFLSDDFGYSDTEAGTIYGAWGALASVYGIFIGFVIDRIGVSKSLRVGHIISLIGRAVTFFTSSRAVLLSMLFVVMPIGSSFGIPVLSTGLRRYTTADNRSFAFSLFFVVMNFSMFMSGIFVDTIGITYQHIPGEEQNLTEDVKTLGITTPNWSFTSYRMIILSGIVANLVGFAITLTMREIKVSAVSPVNSSVAVEESIKNDGIERVGTPFKSKREVSPFVPLKENAWEVTKETLKSWRFRRFIAVTAILINIRMLFRHLDATLPKYMQREFGEDVPFGTIYAIDPLVVIVLTPLISAYTQHVDPLVMILIGTYVTAFSVFFVAFSTTIWATVCFVAILALGEAIWSPNFYNYAVSVAPEGREGMYMSLVSAPLFVAKLPVGYMSGKLLEIYVPATGPTNGKMMWLIIAFTTLSSPVLLSIFWKCLSNTDDESEHEKEGVDKETLRFAAMNEGMRMKQTDSDGIT